MCQNNLCCQSCSHLLRSWNVEPTTDPLKWGCRVHIQVRVDVRGTGDFNTRRFGLLPDVVSQCLPADEGVRDLSQI